LQTKPLNPIPNFPDIKVLVYEFDEGLTNLFTRFLEKSKLSFKFAPTFTDLLKDFRSKQYKACFIDIDLNFGEDELEKFIKLIQKVKLQEESFRTSQIYCIYCKYY
jgi:DNA-binding response OmpR family regulator